MTALPLCKHQNPLGACPKCAAIAAAPFTPKDLAREKDVQAQVAGLYVQVGFDVTNLSQVRASMVRCGIGDLFLMREGLAAWHETKLDGGVQSLEQERFEAACRRQGIPYVLGGVYEQLAWLVERGLWRLPAGVALERLAIPTLVQKQSAIDARRDARRAARHTLQTTAPEA